MEIADIVDINSLIETKIVWAKTGKKITRKYRCAFGKRKGRVVSDPSQCGKPIDLKKRLTLRKTKARVGSRMIRKAKLTKRVNPLSKRVKAMNKK